AHDEDVTSGPRSVRSAKEMYMTTLAICVAVFTWSSMAGELAQPDSAKSAQASGASDKTADTTPLVHEAIVNAPPSEVWKVWTTNEGFKKLGVAHAEVDYRVGGLMRSHYNPKGVLGDE